MPKLLISQFSCISHAEIEVSPLTIIIGPQASGKSVICKLLYFFYTVISQKSFDVEEYKEWKEFSNSVVSDFKFWIPPSARGGKKFIINFSAGPIELNIVRTISGNRAGNNVKFTSSPFLEEQFSLHRSLFTKRQAKEDVKSRGDRAILEDAWRIDSLIRKNMNEALKDDYYNTQSFIPAGRSFFTSMGKTIVAFDRSGLLDPVTVAFGRLFTGVRERWNRRTVYSTDPAAQRRSISRRQTLAQSFFGGEIRIEGDKEYVTSGDGRKIPFSNLSSGQQELLPLWMTLESRAERRQNRQLVYVEEPEAHLFPTAQSALVEYLLALTTGDTGLSLLITTHSPYILAKCNNFIKAFSLSVKGGDSAKAQINKIVPRSSWLNPDRVRAYAMINHSLQSIMSDDGLIDGEYIDEVSNEIASEFSRLLDIEFEQ
jgi:AAA domain, putative AbiEii toxin, Type IV TA system